MKLAKVVGVAVAVLTVAAAIYVARSWDRVWSLPEPDLHASADPAIIKRGEYLVYGPAHCVECHVSSSDEIERAADQRDREWQGQANCHPTSEYRCDQIHNLQYSQ